MISDFCCRVNETSLFWDVTRRRLVGTDFSGQPDCPFFRGQVNMGTKACPETSVRKYQSTLRSIPEEQRSRNQTASMATARLSAPT